MRKEQYANTARSREEVLSAISGGSLKNWVIAGVDLSGFDIPWDKVDVDGTVFLGSKFPSVDIECGVRSRGAHIFSHFQDLPYDPYRTELYTPEELMGGYREGAKSSLDERIYRHFVDCGGHDPNIVEALAQRIHDYSIDRAIKRLLSVDETTGMPKRKAVGFMGGHAMRRDDEHYKKTAQLARLVTRAGYFVVSGGGPGIMEAANLGAYLSNQDESAIHEAIKILSRVPSFKMPDGGINPGSIDTAQQVIERFPGGADSLSIPTWFYGHEPVNLFGTYIGKYFSNSIREDGLLAISIHGIIYAPGGACTIQEVFTDAAQNHYGTFDWYSPMLFLGTGHYLQSQVFSCLTQQAAGNVYAQLITISDDGQKLLDFLKQHPPLPTPSNPLYGKQK